MVLKQIALTGSSGMLGRHITYGLIKNNYEVLASSRTRTPIKHVNLKWKYLDLSKKLNHIILDKIFGKVSAIIHAGAYVPYFVKNLIQKNLLDTMFMLLIK